MTKRYQTLDVFAKQKLVKPTVLIVEPNPYHGEILPGYTKLWQELGYTVHVLIRSEVAAEDPFVAYPATSMPQIFHGSAAELKGALSWGLIQDYEVVFFSTNVFWEGRVNYSSYIDYLEFVPRGKYGSLFVEHNLLSLELDDSSFFYKQNRVFTLLEYEKATDTTTMVNPNYFGEMPGGHELGATRNILVLGATSREKDNLKVLYAAIKKLDKSERKKLHFTIIGGRVTVPKEFPEVTAEGRVDFKRYYKLLQDSDYLLTLINPNEETSLRYKTGTTSGTVQVSMGFKKPMLMNEQYVEHYGFDATDAIPFKEGNLADCLKDAAAVSGHDYQKLTKALSQKAGKIEKTSLANLRRAMSHLKAADFTDIKLIDEASLILALKQRAIVEARQGVAEEQQKIDELEHQLKERDAQIDALARLLQSKRYRLAAKLGDQLNKVLPVGSIRRKTAMMSLKAARYMRLSKEEKAAKKAYRLGAKRQAEFDHELLKLANAHATVIVYPSMQWDHTLRQRPHHIAEQLANLGVLVIYIDRWTDNPRKLTDSLVIANDESCIDVVRNSAAAHKYFMLHSTYAKPFEDIQKIVGQGFEFVYEYIDELDETISGDLTQQKELFSRLEELHPPLLLASASILYNQLAERFPKQQLLMSQNAVDMTHFDSAIKRTKEEIPADLKNVVERGNPIVGFYGAIAPWLDYDLLNTVAERRPDLSFVFLGVDYNDGLKELKRADNVFYLGPKNYTNLPDYSYWFDCATIPFKEGEIAKATSPVKLFEYMAMGLPTVCTKDLRECEGYDYVYMSKNMDDFEKNLDKAIKSRRDGSSLEPLLEQARKHTWQARAKTLYDKLSTINEKN